MEKYNQDTKNDENYSNFLNKIKNLESKKFIDSLNQRPNAQKRMLQQQQNLGDIFDNQRKLIRNTDIYKNISLFYYNNDKKVSLYDSLNNKFTVVLMGSFS